MATHSPPRIERIVFSREDLLTATEVAEVLRLKRTTALDYMRRGVIPAFKIGRGWYALRSQLCDYLASASHSSGR